MKDKAEMFAEDFINCLLTMDEKPLQIKLNTKLEDNIRVKDNLVEINSYDNLIIFAQTLFESSKLLAQSFEKDIYKKTNLFNSSNEFLLSDGIAHIRLLMNVCKPKNSKCFFHNCSADINKINIVFENECLLIGAHFEKKGFIKTILEECSSSIEEVENGKNQRRR